MYTYYPREKYKVCIDILGKILSEHCVKTHHIRILILKVSKLKTVVRELYNSTPNSSDKCLFKNVVPLPTSFLAL